MEKYWNQRYIKGGISGTGSRGDEREWRWNLIKEYVPSVDEIVDVGCGDLAFWEGKDCRDYTGIDISKTIIESNRLKRPNWKFINASSEIYIESLQKECVICLGVLFHIMDEDVFRSTLKNICKYSNKYIVIYTWIENPFNRKNSFKRLLTSLKNLNVRNIFKNTKNVISPSVSDNKYQYYRPLEDYFYIFRDGGFDLIERKNTPDDVGAFYFFKKNFLKY